MQHWRNAVKFLNVDHSVHPSEPVAPDQSEFLEVSNNVRLRIIHVKAKNPDYQTAEETNRNSINKNRRSRTSLYEEYWFTRNKPARYQKCNCSFRRSQRYSALLNDKHESQVQKTVISKNPAVEAFVDSIIEDCFLEALREYVTISCSEFCKGYHNEGFANTENNLDLGANINLRKKHSLSKNNHLKNESTNQSIIDVGLVCSSNNLRTSELLPNEKKKCVHNASTGSKPLVILFHGIGTSADLWWSVINCLSSKGYDVVAPDMLGHGYSSVPNQASAYRFKNLLKHALAIFEHYVELSESKKTIIIAHSLGCSIAAAICRQKMQQVSQLILISGGGPTPLAPPAESEIRIIRCLQTAFRPLLFCGVKRTFLYSSRGKHFNNCDENITVVPRHVLQYIIKGQNWPEGDAAYHRKILIPTLLVYGLQDKQVTLVQECEMERTIPRSFLELIPNCGHFPMLETPEQLNHMITCFVNWWSRE